MGNEKILCFGEKHYEVVQEVISSEMNNGYVCVEHTEESEVYKTVLEVKDRSLAKQMLQDFEEKGAARRAYEACFTEEQSVFFVFPYESGRPLGDFYNATVLEGVAESRVWEEFVLCAMTSPLPPKFLYLILEQKQVSVAKDGSIHLHYMVDLDDYANERTEADLAALCALDICSLISRHVTGSHKRFRLIAKKLERNQYQELLVLYKDLHTLAAEPKKRKRTEQLRGFFHLHEQSIFIWLKRICFLMLLLIVILVIFHLIFGNLGFYQLFLRSFRKIGTESLLQ